MKHNIIFAVLTALILALGFYGVDIVGHFISADTAENAVIPRDLTNTNAVYLNEGKKKFEPMSIVQKTAESVASRENTEVRDLATGMITAMAEYYTKSTIDTPAVQPLRNSLKFSLNGYIYVQKWEYLNPRNETRYLDCIIWTDDLSIAYIRFYSGEDIKLTGTEMNSGLDRIDAFSSSFYPNTSNFYWKLEEVKNELYDKRYASGNNGLDDETRLLYYELLDIFDIGQNEDADYAAELAERKYRRYSETVRSRCGSPDNPLVAYWIPQLSFNDIYTSKGTMVVGGSKIVNIFNNLNGLWVKPSYSAENGMIYQTLQAGKDDLTVIYNVRDDMIEGFYFPATSELDAFGYSNNY